MGKRAAERPNRYFSFLRRLRAGGRSNMYGAIPYLSAAFGCDREEAFRIVCEWIDTQADAPGPAVVPAPRAAAPVKASRDSREPTLFDQPAPPAPARSVSSSTARPAARPASRPSRPKAKRRS